MIAGRIGLLRTLPPAEQWGIDKLRHTAKGLNIDWPGRLSYPDFVRTLGPRKPAHLAMLNACTVLFRGAGYTAFDGSLSAVRRFRWEVTPHSPSVFNGKRVAELVLYFTRTADQQNACQAEMRHGSV